VAAVGGPPRAEARLLALLVAAGQSAGTAKPPVFSRDSGWMGKLAGPEGP
jgi:hypothetical protein